MRDWYMGRALAFQAIETGSSPVSRSKLKEEKVMEIFDKITILTLIMLIIPLISYLAYLIITGKDTINDNDDGNDMEDDSIKLPNNLTFDRRCANI